MNIHWIPISGFFYINALVSAGIAGRSWIMRSHPGLKFFALLAASAALYSLTYGLEIGSPSLALKIYWAKIENISIVVIPPFWLLFAVRYTRQAGWLASRRAVLLFAIPFITIFLMLSQWSYLYFTVLSALPSTAGGPLIMTPGIWYWLQIDYNYGLLMAGALTILWFLIKHPEIYRSQKAIILLGAAIPWLSNLYYVFGSIWFPRSYLPIDLTSMGFSMSGVLYSIGIFHLRLRNLIPMARDIVFENIPDLVMALDDQSRIVDLNRTGREWLGLDGQNTLGRDAFEILPELAEVVSQRNDAPSASREIQISGAPARDVELVVTPLLNRRGQFSGHLIVGRDITARKQADRLLAETSKHMNLQSAALEAAANAIVITDHQGLCIWVNPAFTKITGYSLEEMLGERLSKLKSGIQNDDFYRNLWQVILKGEVWNGEIVNKHKDGHLYTEEMTIAPVRNNGGEITNFIAIKQDITERKKIEADLQNANLHLKLQVIEIETLQDKLHEQAIRDPLTNLFNRRYLEETLEREIAQARRNERGLCVAMLDVDHFKDFNDRYGHMVGDMILESLSNLLIKYTRQSDIVCRYGGDEIVVVMPDMSGEAAFRRAEQWKNLFQANYESFNSQDIRASISVGIAIFPAHGENGQALINSADRALYQAKANGRNNVTIFDHTDTLWDM